MTTSKPAEIYSRDHAAAVQYINARPEGNIVTDIMSTLVWSYRSCDTIQSPVYSANLVHELSPATLHAWPCWGELFFGTNEDPVQFDTMECFVAYTAARWW